MIEQVWQASTVAPARSSFGHTGSTEKVHIGGWGWVAVWMGVAVRECGWVSVAVRECGWVLSPPFTFARGTAEINSSPASER